MEQYYRFNISHTKADGSPLWRAEDDYYDGGAYYMKTLKASKVEFENRLEAFKYEAQLTVDSNNQYYHDGKPVSKLKVEAKWPKFTIVVPEEPKCLGECRYGERFVVTVVKDDHPLVSEYLYGEEQNDDEAN